MNLYVNGERVSNSLYRVGGFGVKLDEPYFMLIKYTEDYHPDKITLTPKERRCLMGRYCIINNNGDEKITFNMFDCPYIYGCIYSLGSKYYNIKTGELYCDSCRVMHSDKYLFLNNLYDEDKGKRGVWKIDKITGAYEIFE